MNKGQALLRAFDFLGKNLDRYLLKGVVICAYSIVLTPPHQSKMAVGPNWTPD